ncbi:type VI secretion system baseplate subunit TssF [Pseudomonas sp. v388]|uniref:type VI secretion system baseplate subunit TssF n=1 Tax=Pseudomonas sp. v388 TaxID=2479849 RepID=UPI000F7B24B9|nr:type VI secretion system baseplate subunit TssF [Pseudomonas sp. v388]RRV05322.1 type VI secretion system baseplate subunit TssF [Pseudomonas sp. v388]
MSFNLYYQSELSALRQLGRQFADRNPALAPYLGQAARDPDVERLLEGFAFLTGRLRQKLDDELPELTHSLMHLLWPNYMRPFPAMSMVQFEPLDQPGPGVLVERDTAVESDPVEGKTCRFRTCYATQVLPLRLDALSCAAKGDAVALDLRLGMTCEGHLGELQLTRLRLHLAGERYISDMLYLGLLRQLTRIRLTLLDADGHLLSGSSGDVVELDLPVQHVRPVGFAEDEALIPYPLNTFRGYRYLQEYFCFPEKFLFVDLLGLHVLQSLPTDTLEKARGLILSLEITSSELQHLQPTAENVKLYCTPVVNLFEQDAVPIRLEGKQDEYLLMPAGYGTQDCSVYSVDKVTGWQAGALGCQDYVPFESFEHDPSFDVQDARPYYSVRQRASVTHDGLDTFLSFDVRDLQRHETISIELTCTNNSLPLHIPANGICHFAESAPDFVRFRNITPATRSYAPPINREFLWKLISNMSLNYLSLANIEALKVILETYDLPRYHDQQAEKVSRQLLNGLKSIGHTPVDRLFRGLPVRGLRTDLVIDPQGYLGEGSLFLFASVLNEFFALYASLNSFHQLHVTSTQGARYEWTPRMGQQPLL